MRRGQAGPVLREGAGGGLGRVGEGERQPAHVAAQGGGGGGDGDALPLGQQDGVLRVHRDAGEIPEGDEGRDDHQHGGHSRRDPAQRDLAGAPDGTAGGGEGRVGHGAGQASRMSGTPSSLSPSVRRISVNPARA